MSDIDILEWIYLYGLAIHFLVFFIRELRGCSEVGSPYDILRVIFWFVWAPIILILSLVKYKEEVK